MKIFLRYMIVGILSLCNTLVCGQEVNQRKLIVIDPGHGGIDSGSVGVNGIQEKDVVLGIAQEIILLNDELFKDSLEIYLTRYSDTLISLTDRTKLAKTLKADIFVSIHCNQARRARAQGIEVYHSNAGDYRSEQLATHFILRFKQKLRFKSRGVKQNNFQVLRETKTCPAVLLELGFLSNKIEAEHNSKQSSLTAYALIILQTLVKF